LVDRKERRVTHAKVRRLRRLRREDGRAVIVAMDHGAFFGVQPGLDRPGEVIRQVIAGGADAVMATFGIAQACARELAEAGLILRIDGGVSRLGQRTWRGRQTFDVETALRLGADGVVVMGFPGSENEDQNLQDVAAISEQCHEWGLPLVAEMLPRAFEGGDDARTAENIANAVRIGAELGADLIKTQYTGSVESFRQVLKSAFVPVVVLGGAKMPDDAAVLQTVYDSVQAGGCGVAMGRNLWGHREPEKMTAAVAAIVHDGATVEQALARLGQ
jgi:DhnA family fructose-bisphosphate aldolase class Ia